MEKQRIAKYLSRAGQCSRRKAEEWIAQGRVAVNQTILTTPAIQVEAGDTVTVDGRVIAAIEPTRLFRYHKPVGEVTTSSDEKGRKTVFEALPTDLPRLISVGRLDINSEGLLLMTNDGELSRYLEHPTTGWTREYRVRVYGRVSEKKLHDLRKGITVKGFKYASIQAQLDRQENANAWLSMSLREGKNREIRKILDHLGLQVNRLVRTSYGPFYLDHLPRGAIEEIPAPVLKDFLDAHYRR